MKLYIDVKRAKEFLDGYTNNTLIIETSELFVNDRRPFVPWDEVINASQASQTSHLQELSSEQNQSKDIRMSISLSIS